MSKIKLILLAAFAVMAVSAAASSSASAFRYLIEGQALTANETVESEGGEAVLTGPGTKITCAMGTDTGIIEPGGLGTYHILFLGSCAVVEPAGCIVHEPILVSGIQHLALIKPGELGVKFLPPAGTNTFVTLTFLNKGTETCSLGNTEVTGLAEASVEGGEESKETGVLNFTNTSGSVLKLAGATAKFTYKDKVKLSGANKGKKWSAMME